MIEITTLTDRRVSDYTEVGRPDWLRERGLFVAEGRLVVRRLFQAPSFRVRSVLITRTALSALADILDSGRCPIYVCDQDAMNQLTGYNFHRGCLAIGECPTAAEPGAFASARRLMAVEGVGNPDNVGGLFRVAAAFDVDGILLDRTSGDPLYRKAIRTSMGAVFKVPFIQTDDWLHVLAEMREAGADLVALTPDQSATKLPDYATVQALDRSIVLMVGAEGPGLTSDALAAATVKLRIPMADGVDSLNVVVAAGIALSAVFNPSARLSGGFDAGQSRAGRDAC